MDPLVLSLDIGGTVVKAALFDAEGRVAALASAPVDMLPSRHNRFERDPAAMWQACVTSMRSVLQDADRQRVVALACTGHGNGIYLADERGRPTRPGIVSIDLRAHEILREIEADGRAAQLEELTGSRPWGGQSILQLAWIARHEPEVASATRWALTCKDFVRMRLTGEAVSDFCDASGGALLNLATGERDPAIYELLKIPEWREKVPEPILNSEIAGYLTSAASEEIGLPKGLPVAAAMMDVGACVIGSGVLDSDAIAMISGTWSINAALTKERPGGPAVNLTALHRDRETILVSEGSPSSAANLHWYVSKVLPPAERDLEAIGRAVAATSPDESDCLFLPHVYGPRPRTGALLGLTDAVSGGGILRAIFEGVAFKHRALAEVVDRTLGGNGFRVIRLSGGAANSEAWAQVFADGCGLPVETSEAGEIGALGAAMCAFVAARHHSDLQTAARAMTRVKARYEPQVNWSALYQDRFMRFAAADADMETMASARA